MLRRYVRPWTSYVHHIQRSSSSITSLQFHRSNQGSHFSGLCSPSCFIRLISHSQYENAIKQASKINTQEYIDQKRRDPYESEKWNSSNGLELSLVKALEDPNLLLPFLKQLLNSTLIGLDKNDEQAAEREYDVTTMPDWFSLETYKSKGGAVVLPLFTSAVRVYSYLQTLPGYNPDETAPRQFVEIDMKLILPELVKDNQTCLFLNPYSLNSCSFTPEELSSIYQELVILPALQNPEPQKQQS